MAGKKKTTKKAPKETTSKISDNNLNILFKKVDNLAKEVDTIQTDIRDMAIELIKVGNEHKDKQSLMERIKNRLGL